jgi:putative phosphoesterase
LIHVVVLSDTHIRRHGRRRLPSGAYRHLETADLVLHAGDLVDDSVLEDLGRFAPLLAVLGNNDRTLVGLLPETVETTLEGVALAMVHDSGPRQGRERRMARRFPHADVVIFGHSHIPWNEDGSQLLFNPGSPTERRRQPHHTLGTLDFEDGVTLGHAIHVLDS